MYQISGTMSTLPRFFFSDSFSVTLPLLVLVDPDTVHNDVDVGECESRTESVVIWLSSISWWFSLLLSLSSSTENSCLFQVSFMLVLLVISRTC